MAVVCKKLVISVVMMLLCDGQDRCTTTSDCACGQQCVTGDMKICGSGDTKCVCRFGCVVFDQYITPGTNSMVYGNLCYCPRMNTKEKIHEQFTSCTTASWRGHPRGVEAHPHHPNCPTAGL